MLFKKSEEPKIKHSVPCVWVQIDIGGNIPGIKAFCDKCLDCRQELARALQEGGRLVESRDRAS